MQPLDTENALESTDGSDAKHLIHQANVAAKREMDAIKQESPLAKASFDAHLRTFILAKFHLLDVELPTADFDEIVELSISRSTGISKELVREFDIAKDCQGASTSMTKKVLLFITIQNQLGIELPGEKSAYLRTMQDLCDLVWAEMTQSDGWQSRLSR